MARFKAGEPSGNPKGRPRGSKNKHTAEIRDQILASLKHRGGIDYLNGLEDEEFVKLLARVIPKDLNVSGDLNVGLVIERSFVKKP